MSPVPWQWRLHFFALVVVAPRGWSSVRGSPKLPIRLGLNREALGGGRDAGRFGTKPKDAKLSMRYLLRICSITACLIAAAGCDSNTPRETSYEPTMQFGNPSITHIAKQAQPEALAAFEHAKRFVTEGRVNTSELDILNPEVSHWCPPQSVYFDWLVSFPRKLSTSPGGSYFPVAVLKDGTCWVWQPPSEDVNMP